MATNDNRAMVEAARLYSENCDLYNEPIEAMADFALEQSALAVAAGRTRIGDELQTMHTNICVLPSGYICEICDYIDKLRAERDADR